MEKRRVVITGLGAMTPLGNTVEEYWNNLVAGVSGAAPITLFDTKDFKTQFACEVKNFNPTDYLERKEARKMDRFTQFGMVVADEAITDSQIDMNEISPDRVGVIWGSGIGGIDTMYQQTKAFVDNNLSPRFNPFFIPMMIADITPGQISMKHGLRGPNFTTVSACASATNALIDACTYIQLGKADIIVSGGSEAAITQVGMGGFNAMHALSKRNDDPQTASRPFDKDRDGFVMGEGGACLIVEDYEHAKKRGAKIYAEIIGSGMSADAHHLTAPHPEGLGAKNVMSNTLNEAGVQPSDIDYINVHGTSTPLGDIAETLAIKSVFGESAYDLNISSTKSMTGHLLGAAGAVESVASILAIKNGIIPPTINHFTDDPELDNNLNLTFNKPQNCDVRAALSNTFGFGGHNASILFKKFEE